VQALARETESVYNGVGHIKRIIMLQALGGRAGWRRGGALRGGLIIKSKTGRVILNGKCQSRGLRQIEKYGAQRA